MRLTSRLIWNGILVTGLLVAALLLIIDVRMAMHVRDAGVPATIAALLTRELHGDLLIAGIAVLLLGVVLTQQVTRSMTRPLTELKDVVDDLATGDLSKRPQPVDGVREVRELSESVRVMAERLDTRLWELQSEEALLVALTESLNEGVVAVDARKRVVRINERGRQLLRLRQPLPFAATELPDHPGLQEALQAVLSGAPPLQRELLMDERTVQLTARALRGGGAIVAMLDLTPIRRLEVVRRDFVANVSHELRTPLTVISGFVETLHDEDLPAALRQQFLGMVDTNVQRMQRIVDDLLDLSRIESGGWRPTPEIVALPDIAAEVFAPLQRTAIQKGVTIRADMAPDARDVFCDPTAVRQILANLTQNALRHTSNGEVVLFARRDDGGVTMGVRDTGSGIAPEHLPRIFERFYRADPGRSREAGGTGLGLAIVRHLTEAHEGRVQVESVVGSGTTFSVFLPDPLRPA
jgi:signal transduction histidine kinase